MTVQSVSVKKLRPTQIAVGMKLVKHKRKGLRERERKPQELVDFILANPIRVVAGPNDQFYVIDHHHLGLALLDESFKTAPVMIEGDFSTLAMPEFWRQMEGKSWLYPFDGKGRKRPIDAIPSSILKMEDDPYRSLAGFVRLEGGYTKTLTPFMDFAWADYFRDKISLKEMKKDYNVALAKAMKLAASADAKALPGYTPKPLKPAKAIKKAKAPTTPPAPATDITPTAPVQ